MRSPAFFRLLGFGGFHSSRRLPSPAVTIASAIAAMYAICVVA
jgi:hypothetical protein